MACNTLSFTPSLTTASAFGLSSTSSGFVSGSCSMVSPLLPSTSPVKTLTVACSAASDKETASPARNPMLISLVAAAAALSVSTAGIVQAASPGGLPGSADDAANVAQGNAISQARTGVGSIARDFDDQTGGVKGGVQDAGQSAAGKVQSGVEQSTDDGGGIVGFIKGTFEGLKQTQ